MHDGVSGWLQAPNAPVCPREGRLGKIARSCRFFDRPRCRDAVQGLVLDGSSRFCTFSWHENTCISTTVGGVRIQTLLSHPPAHPIMTTCHGVAGTQDLNFVVQEQSCEPFLRRHEWVIGYLQLMSCFCPASRWRGTSGGRGGSVMERGRSIRLAGEMGEPASKASPKEL